MFDAFEQLYQQAILDRSAHPRHAGRLAVFDATARGDNPMCGDRVQVWVRRAADGRVAEAGFEARGCKLSVASADLMAEAVIGTDSEQVHALAAAFADFAASGVCPDCGGALGEKLAGLRPLSGVHAFPSRIKCTTLPWTALLLALDAEDGSGEVGGGMKEAGSE